MFAIRLTQYKSFYNFALAFHQCLSMLWKNLFQQCTFREVFSKSIRTVTAIEISWTYKSSRDRAESQVESAIPFCGSQRGPRKRDQKEHAKVDGPTLNGPACRCVSQSGDGPVGAGMRHYSDSGMSIVSHAWFSVLVQKCIIIFSFSLSLSILWYW